MSDAYSLSMQLTQIADRELRRVQRLIEDKEYEAARVKLNALRRDITQIAQQVGYLALD